MASTLKIVLAVVEKGFESFENLTENFQKLQSSLEDIESTPLDGLESHVKAIDKNVEKIEDRFAKVINSVIKQTVNGLNATTDKVGQQTDKFLEKIYTVGTISFAGVLAFGVKSFSEAIFDFQNGVLTASGFFTNLATSTITTITNLAVNSFDFIHNRLNSLAGIIGTISANIGNFAPVLGGFVNLFTKFTLGAASLGFVSVIFNEWRLTLNRLIGRGIYGLKPLERATRLLFTIDSAVHSIGFSFGQVFKVIGLGFATFIGPFSGIIAGIPFLNSLVTTALRAGTRLRDYILTSLGSGQAQFRLFFFDIRTLALGLVPVLQKNLKVFTDSVQALGGFKIKATEAEQKIKAMGAGIKDFDKIKALANLKLPFTQQFQGFRLEIKALLEETQQRLIFMSLLISKALGVTKQDLNNINKESQTIFASSKKSINNLTADFGKIFESARKQGRTFTEKWKERFKSIGVVAKGAFGKIIKAIAFAPFKGGFFSIFGQKSTEQSKKTADNIIKATEPSKILEKSAIVTSSALKSMETSINKVFTEIKGSGATVATIVKSVETIDKAAKAVPQVAQNINSQIIITRGEVEKLVKDVFSLSAGFKGISKGTPIFGKGKESSAVFRASIDAIIAFADKRKDIKSSEKALNRLVRIFDNLASVIKPELKDRIEKFYNAVGDTSKIIRTPKDFEHFKKAVQNLVKVLTGTRDLTKNAGQKAGDSFVSFISTALREGKNTKELEKAVEALAQVIAAFFPQSLPQRGPLTNIIRMGALIPFYIGQGIIKGLSGITSVMEKIPLAGPIITKAKSLVKVGVFIPFYLAKGILSGAYHVVGAVEKVVGFASSSFKNLTDFLKERAEKTAEIGFFAERIGVTIQALSSLQNVTAQVGDSIQSLQFVFSRMNSTLSKTLTGDETKKFKDLGIDLDKIRQTQEPVIALFLELADIIEQNGLQSDKATKALSAFGVTANTKIINVLKLGREEIIRLQKQGIELGNTFDKTFSETSKKLNAFFKTIELIKTGVINDILKEVIPTLVSAGNKVIEIIETNRSRIKLFLTIAGQGIAALTEIILTFIELLVDNPKKAFNVLIFALEGFFKFTKNSVMLFLPDIENIVLSFFKKIGVYIISFPLSFVKNLYKEIKVVTKKFLENISSALVLNFKITMRKIRNILHLETNQTNKDIERLHLLLSEGVEKTGFRIANVIDKTTSEVKGKIEKLTKEAEKQKNKALKQDKFEEFKIYFQNFLKDLSGTFSGTDLEDKFKNLLNVFSESNFDEQKNKITEIKDLQIKAIDEIEAKKDEAEQKNKERLQRTFQDENAIYLQTLEIRARDTENLQAKHELELINLDTRHWDELAKIQTKQATEQELKEINYLHNIERAKLLQKQEEEIRNKDLNAIINYMESSKQVLGGFSQAFQDLYELGGKKRKEFAIASKVAALLEATVNVAVGVTKALSTLPPPLSFIQAALIGTMGAVQIAKISATGFAKGGKTPGTGKGDTFPAMLTPGEWNIKEPSSSYYGDHIMSAINKAVFPREALAAMLNGHIPVKSQPAFAFQNGGPVSAMPVFSGFKAQEGQDKELMVNNINFIDQRLFSQYLGTTDGRRSIVNIIGQEASQIKKVLF